VIGKGVEMKLPKTVSISGVVYDIKEVDKLLDDGRTEKLDGNIGYTQTEILFEKEASSQMKAVVLCHEVIHGLLTHAGIEHNEQLVTVLGYGICGFIQENKEVIREMIK
jgi:glutamine synthetase type III